MRIGLNKTKSENITKELNTYLANLHVLYTKLHNYHWNIVGLGFFEIHVKLEELYNSAAVEIDDVAERILTLEGTPLASMKDYLETATLKEAESKKRKSDEIIEDVYRDFQALLGDLRNIVLLAADNNDEQTVGMLDGYIGNYEKSLWMLGAYLVK